MAAFKTRLGRALSLMIAIPSLLFGALPVSAAEYLLGPKDQIRLKVTEWRTGSSEMRDWTPMAGEFEVGASGALSLPLLGDVQASGLSPSQLSQIIAERLWKSVGLAQKPTASVEVSRYRPFFVTGGVNRPGDYPYVPGLTVLQAVSISGGLLRRLDGAVNQFERDALSSHGDMQEELAEQDGLQLREARLDAEAKEATTITFPANLIARKNEPQITKLMANEQDLWTIRRNALHAQVQSYQQTKSILNQQIVSMQSKSQTLAHEAALAETELTNVKALISKGYIATARQLDVEQNAAQYASQRLDLDIAMLRAQQDISAADRSIQQIVDEQKAKSVAELSLTRVSLAKIAERVKTDRALVYNASVTMPELYLSMQSADAQQPRYTILRNDNGARRTIQADENQEVMPGDIVKVVLPTLGVGAAPSAALAASAQPQD